MSKKPALFSELFVILIIGLVFIFFGLDFVSLEYIDFSIVLLFFTLALRSFSYTSQIITSFSKIKIEVNSFVLLSEKLTTLAKKSLNSEKISYVGLPLRKIALEDFSFSFNQKNILFEVNLNIPLQSHILINGNSGSGKSTFLDLLVGLYSGQNGKIFVYDIENKFVERDINLFGYVSQNVGLFGATLEECVCGKNVFIKDKFELIINLCKLDNIYNDKSNFNTLTISGGEKLRVALSRALYYDRPILILDESLSAIEHSLEIKILDDIKLNFPNITIFQVVHERSKLTNANFKLIFENQTINLFRVD
jgi:ABC-type bacteriocin/lantibiotic exporter with double-glycine peptidase domain